MIKAKHNIFAEFIFYPYLERLLRKNFSHFFLVNTFPLIDNNAGLVITPNHFSWWDGFFIGHIERKFLHRKFFIMMLEDQLKRYWFFQKVGAYSIQQDNPKSIIETARYTSEIINNKNVVVIYPQGKIESFSTKNLNLKKGLNLFTKNVKEKFYVLPVGFKIEFYEEKLPSVIARFGDLIDGNELINNLTIFENEFTMNLELLEQAANEKKFITDIFGNQK